MTDHTKALVDALEHGLDAANALLAEKQSALAGYPHRWKAEQEAVDAIQAQLDALRTAPSLTVGDEPVAEYTKVFGVRWLSKQPYELLAGAELVDAAGVAYYRVTSPAGMDCLRREADTVPGTKFYLRSAKPAAQAEPVAFVHWPLNGPPRLVWYSNKALHEAIEKGNKAQNAYVPDLLLYAPSHHPAQGVDINQLEKALERYWNAGFYEGKTGDNAATEANEALNTIRSLFRAAIAQAPAAKTATEGGE